MSFYFFILSPLENSNSFESLSRVYVTAVFGLVNLLLYVVECDHDSSA